MKEAAFCRKLDADKVSCSLCAHACVINSGKRGKCAVRENRGGTLYSLVYGKVIAQNVDPIEKKPLFHFYPGSRSFSIATVGCNFRCSHCQNFDIAQYPKGHDQIPGQDVDPAQIVDSAETAGCRSISYTYTEPTVFFEFAYDCAKMAHERGIMNVFVSNGYTGPNAVKEISPFLDGINIDLKGDDDFYKKVCGARLQPVLDTIKLMKHLGVWVEVTTLIIPSYNDSETSIRDIAEFISSVDPGIPWHVTQFYPTYKITDQPPTPVETLQKARKIGKEAGLLFIYEGNVPGSGSENTYCPSCGDAVLERSGYRILNNALKGACCPRCSSEINGVF